MTTFWKTLKGCHCEEETGTPDCPEPTVACLECIKKALAALATPKDVDGPKPESGNLVAYQQGWKNAFDFLREQTKRG